MNNILKYIIKISIFFSFNLFCLVAIGQDEIFDLSPTEKVTETEINKRIEKYRMGDLIIHAPAGAKVKIEQTRHEFLFGTAIPNELAKSNTSSFSEKDRKKYLKVLEENFNVHRSKHTRILFLKNGGHDWMKKLIKKEN